MVFLETFNGDSRKLQGYLEEVQKVSQVLIPVYTPEESGYTTEINCVIIEIKLKEKQAGLH